MWKELPEGALFVWGEIVPCLHLEGKLSAKLTDVMDMAQQLVAGIIQPVRGSGTRIEENII